MGRRAVALALTALPLALVGCLSLGDGGTPEPRPGQDTFRLFEREARSLAGCRYDYRVFEPVGSSAPSSSVVLGHGFLRDQDTMVGLARALANAGHRAITLDFCNMRPWNGNHARNAADLAALAEREGIAGRTVYAGFSAGALAALLAAAGDDDALGVLTLDLVDQASLGTMAAAELASPLTGLFGPDSACNANGNGRAAFLVAGQRTAIRASTIDGASHCEFESPTTWLCELACGDETPLSDSADGPSDGAADAAQRQRIIAAAVAAVDDFAATGAAQGGLARSDATIDTLGALARDVGDAVPVRGPSPGPDL